MKKIFICTIGLLALVAASGLAMDNVTVEIGLNGANTSNLLSDYSGVTQRSSMNTATVSLYPTAMARIDLKGEYTYYQELSDLTNYMIGGGVVFLPFDKDAPVTVHLSADFETRRYRSSFLTFNSTDTWNAMASVGRQISPSTHARSGLKYTASIYTDSDVPTKNTYQFFAGLSKSLGGTVTLDVEAGYSSGNYTYVDSATFLDSIAPLPYDDIASGSEYDGAWIKDGTMSSLYFAPRLSFGLGRHTGVNLTYSYRSFADPDENVCMYGQRSGLTSQWSSDHDGSAVTLGLKTYLVPNFILSAGAGYFDKVYFGHSLESIQIGGNPPTPGAVIIGNDTAEDGVLDREDKQTRVYLSIQLPLASRTGPFIEPSLQVEYTNNTSSVYLYDYDDVTVTAGVKIKL